MWLSVSLIDGKKLVRARFELARLQRQHGAMEPVVGPAIVAGHAAEMIEQVHCLTPASPHQIA